MYDVYIIKLYIEKVRNLKDIEIPVANPEGKRRHLIITGRNGSGKTSLLEAVSKHIDWLAIKGDPKELLDLYEQDQHNLENAVNSGQSDNEFQRIKDRAESFIRTWEEAR